MKSKRSFSHSIRMNILVGVLLVTPVAATIVVFNFLIRLATGWMPQWLAPILDSVQPLYLQRIIVFLLTLLLLFLAGLLGRNLIGRRLYGLGERLMARIPVARDIYTSTSRIIEALFRQRKTLFKEVVLLEYPRRGIYSIAFVTAQLPPILAQTATGSEPDETWVSLFLPTTPNPTSGLLIFAPRSEVRPLKMPVPEALTFVMSAGAVVRRDENIPSTLMERIDEWLQTERDADASPLDEH